MEDNITKLFKTLEGSFDIIEPEIGHGNRFKDKLIQTMASLPVTSTTKKWYRPLLIAASIVAVCFASSLLFLKINPIAGNNVAMISQEAANTDYYFTNIINDQIKELQTENSPETKQIIEDTLAQLQKLAADYKKLESDLIHGGNSNILLSAMITNFQTRLNLLKEVLEKIESIKTIKKQENAEYTT